VAASSCVAQSQVITEDNQALSQAKDTLREDELDGAASVTTDQEQLASDEANAVSAEQALSTAEAQETNSSTTFTRSPRRQSSSSRAERLLPRRQRCSAVLRRDSFYRASTSEKPVPTSPNCKKISSRSASGAGFARAARSTLRPSRHSRPAEILKVPETGVLALGDVVIKPGPIEVDAVSVASGSRRPVAPRCSRRLRRGAS